MKNIKQALQYDAIYKLLNRINKDNSFVKAYEGELFSRSGYIATNMGKRRQDMKL